MKYRPEIDGLRALAVTPVVLFHAGFSGFSGGYVGVDVFFVISGYLITSILLSELRQGRFSILNFYERRARRILPALGFVAIVVLLAALLFMPADLYKGFSASLAHVGTFTSNIYFYVSSGYFATAAEEKPLLHTWSLAVEEQYYLFFPVLLMLLWRHSVKACICALLVLTAASFLWCLYLLSTDALDANFYLIFSRAWELFCGSLLAFMGFERLRKRRILSEMGALLGVGLIIYSVLIFDASTPFPGVATLIPVLGTMLIIVCCSQTSLMGRLLGCQPLVYVGLISYSWYLWHQPLLAFAKMKTIGHPPDGLIWLAIILSVVLAVVSHRYIEKPFRNRRFLSRKQVFKYALLVLLSMTVVGWVGYAADGFPQRFQVPDYDITSSPMHRKCNTRGSDYTPPSEACEYLGSTTTWAAMGDSHVVEPAFALAKRLEPYDQGVLHLAFTACPNGLSIELNTPKGCSDWSKEAVAAIIAREDIKNVLLVYRYSMHLFGADLSQYPQPPDISPRPYIKADFRRTMIGSARDNYWRSFRDTIDTLLAAGKQVHIVYPIPELQVDFAKAASPFSVFSDRTLLDLTQITSLDFYQARHQYILDKLDALPYDDNLHAIRPAETFCGTTHCAAVLDGKALYRDDDHLTIYGADLLIQHIELP